MGTPPMSPEVRPCLTICLRARFPPSTCRHLDCVRRGGVSGAPTLKPWPRVEAWPREADRLTVCLMVTMTFRTDQDVDQALADLGSGGQDRSQVIRDAIMSAWRERRLLRAEAEALVADADDRREAREVLADMESL